PPVRGQASGPAMFAGGGRQKTGSRGTGFDARPSPLQSIPELKTDIRTFCSALFFRARSSMGETIQPGLYQPLFLQAKDPAVPEGPKGGFIPAKGEREEAVRSVQRSEERRVGKECRSRGRRNHLNKNIIQLVEY